MNDQPEQEGEREAQGSGGRTPPYVSFKTYQTLLEELKTNGIPHQIDRSVLSRFAGGIQGQLMSALKAMSLMDDENRPTPALRETVDAYGTDEFASLLDKALRRVYPYVFELDLAHATPSMFAKAFSDNTGAKEDVLRKCRTFFLHAAKEAGVPLGSRIQNAKFPRSRTANPRKPKSNSSPPQPEANSAARVAQPQITEKALEYRLVDLMTDAMNEPEVVQAILRVVTFLKARDAAAKTNTATDQ